MIRIKKTYSLFCKKRPQKGLIYACVYFPKETIWRVIQGKLYADGRFRYLHNGVEGIASRYNNRTCWRPETATKELHKLATDLNIINLEAMFPKPFPKRSQHFLDAYLPIVDEEDDLTIE